MVNTTKTPTAAQAKVHAANVRAGDIAFSSLPAEKKAEAFVALGRTMWSAAFDLAEHGKLSPEVKKGFEHLAGMLRSLGDGDKLADALASGFVGTAKQQQILDAAAATPKLSAQQQRTYDENVVVVTPFSDARSLVTLKGSTSLFDVRSDLATAAQKLHPGEELIFSHAHGSLVEEFAGQRTAPPLDAAACLGLAAAIGRKFHGIKSVTVEDGAVRVGVNNHFEAWDAKHAVEIVRGRLGDVPVRFVRETKGERPAFEIQNGFATKVWPDGTRSIRQSQPVFGRHAPPPEQLAKLGVHSMEGNFDTLTLRMSATTTPAQARAAAEAAKSVTGSDYVHVWLKNDVPLHDHKGSLEQPIRLANDARQQVLGALRERWPAFNSIGFYGWSPAANGRSNDDPGYRKEHEAVLKQEQDGNFHFTTGLVLTVDPAFDPAETAALVSAAKQRLRLAGEDISVTVRREIDGNRVGGGDATIAKTYEVAPSDKFRKPH